MSIANVYYIPTLFVQLFRLSIDIRKIKYLSMNVFTDAPSKQYRCLEENTDRSHSFNQKAYIFLHDESLDESA